MERNDFLTGWDSRQEKLVDAAKLSKADQFGLDVRHEVVLTGKTEEVALLARGLEVYRAQIQLQAALTGGQPPQELLIH